MCVRVVIPERVEILKRGFPLAPKAVGVVVTERWSVCTLPSCLPMDYERKRVFKINKKLEPFREVENACKAPCWEFYNIEGKLCGVVCPANRIVYTPSIENFKYIVDNYIVKPRIIVSLGTDVELELSHYSSDLRVRARNTRYNTLTDVVGADGTGGPLEIRVPPALSPKVLRQNLEFILYRLRDYRLTMRCISQSEPLGGHIHICIRNQFMDNLLPRTLIEPLAYLLDYFVGSHFVRHEPYKIRRLYGYGRLYDESADAVRDVPQAHPGIEYRAPSAFIIHDPLFFEITFEIVRRIIDYIFEHPGAELKFSSHNIEQGAKLEDYTTILRMDRNRAAYFLRAFKKPAPTADVRVLWNVVGPRRKRNLSHRMTIAEKFDIIGRMRPADFRRFLRAVENIEILKHFPEKSIRIEQERWWGQNKFRLGLSSQFQTNNELIEVEHQPYGGRPFIVLPYSLTNEKLARVREELSTFFRNAYISMYAKMCGEKDAYA